MAARSKGRSTAAVLLAFLLGWTLVSWFVASANFRVVDRERNPRIDSVFAAIQDPQDRTMAVRFLASESNRALFAATAPVQLVTVLGAGVLFWRGREPGLPRPRLMTVLFALLLLTSLLTAVTVPWFVAAGRAIDFVSRIPEPPPEVRHFLRLHVAYVLLDLVKAGCALGLVVLLLTAHPDRRQSHQ